MSDETPPRLCAICTRKLAGAEAVTCAPCVDRARAVLRDVEQTYTLLPEQLGHPAAQVYDRTATSADEVTVPGGTVLVLLGPGSYGTSARRLTSSEQAAHQEGREHAVDNDPADPPSVHQVLDDWAVEWARHVGFDSQRTTLTQTVAFLQTNTAWAAEHHPAFDDYVRELHRLRAQLQMATATDDRPHRGAARCLTPECDTPLEKTNRDPHRCHAQHDAEPCPTNTRGQRTCGDPTFGPHNHPAPCDCDRGGITDIWHCPRCRRNYKPHEYVLAVRAQIEAAGGRGQHTKRHLRKHPDLAAAVDTAHAAALNGQQDTA